MASILLVTDAWHPQINGVVRVVEKMKEILEARGHSVVMVHPEMFSTVPLLFYPEIRLSLFTGKKIREILDTQKPDHIHLFTEGPLGLTARHHCLKRGLRFTTSYHTHFQLYVHVRYRRFLGFVYGLLSWFHEGASKTMVATQSLKSALEAHNFRHLVVWPIGVDTTVFYRRDTKHLPALERPVFTFFSRLAPEKDPEAFLSMDLPGTKLVIGDGPDREILERKYGTTAKFIGYKVGDELVEWLSHSDVLVFPSRTETFGLVILESLACGVPVAAFDVMGPADIITSGADGYLGSDLRDSALQCLGLSPDRCREKALHYSWEKSADIFLQHLVRARA